MTLTKEQKKDLGRLSEYFKKIEKIAIENNIDLDVFMSEYSEDGFKIYSTEKVNISANASKRKSVFEKAGKEKTKAQERNNS